MTADTDTLCVLPTLLAQAAQGKSTAPVFTWIAILITFAVIGGTFAVLLRKKMFEKQAAADSHRSLMEHLRDAHARGEISSEEYEGTRKSMASRLSQQMDTKRSGGLFELPDPKRPIRRPITDIHARLDTSTPPLLPPEALGAAGEPGERRAPPGYDLTGQPLPRAGDKEAS